MVEFGLQVRRFSLHVLRVAFVVCRSALQVRGFDLHVAGLARAVKDFHIAVVRLAIVVPKSMIVLIGLAMRAAGLAITAAEPVVAAAELVVTAVGLATIFARSSAQLRGAVVWRSCLEFGPSRRAFLVWQLAAWKTVRRRIEPGGVQSDASPVQSPVEVSPVAGAVVPAQVTKAA